MRTLYGKAKAQIACFDNSLSAFVPQLWAMEGVAILVENMVASQLVNRDFQEQFYDFGDTVNTRKPADFDSINKTNADDVTDQDASATNIPIPLDQHCHVSFVIKDGEQSKSFADLVAQYLKPAAIALARRADRVVLGQYAQFLANQYGTLGGLTTSNAVDRITGVRGVLNHNLCPDDGNRKLILGTDSETLILQNPVFHQANTAGDGGLTQRTGFLGSKFNFDNYQCQNMAQPLNDGNTGSGAINNAAGYSKGTTVLTVDGFAASEVVAGQWVTIAGQVHHVVATNNATATILTLEYGLSAAVVDNDVIAVFKGAVSTLTYAAGWNKSIIVDNGSGALPTTAPQVGQLVTFGTANDKYVITKVTTGSVSTSIVLDRPLAAAVTSATVVNYGPSGGGYNFAFHPNALTLVIRPLHMPPEGTGARAGLGVLNGVAMRTVMTYDGKAQGTRVTMDFLAGIKVLDVALGGVMLS